MRHTQLGVTLIEIIIALAIIGILILITVPGFRSFLQNRRVTLVAEELHSALVLARSEAIKRNQLIYVSLTTGDSWCYGLNPGSTCDCNVANSCTLGTYRARAAQQTSLSTTYSGNLIFEGSHAAANASGSITFTVFGTARLISVNIGRLGGLSMCATGLSGYPAC